MRYFLRILAALVLALSNSIVRADIIELEITASWSASDFDVSSTLFGDDDKVFGVAPSAGLTSFTLLVDTSSVVSFKTGEFGVTHDWFGYSHVTLVGTHTFGTASWKTSDILTGLVGPNGSTAALWTDTDISIAAPRLVSFRMIGDWPGGNADLFVGDRYATKITNRFLMWEYYKGEEIRRASNAYAISVAHLVTIASGADNYERPRLNNHDEIVWTQWARVDREIAKSIWSNKRGKVNFDTYSRSDDAPDINDEGEIIWRFGDGGQGPDGIESNIRGLIYMEEGGALDPYYDTNRINNAGEIIWSKPLRGQSVEEIWSNERGRLTFSSSCTLNRQPSINDSGEVVFRTYRCSGPPSNHFDILSTVRGPITDDPAWDWSPDVNNAGHVVWVRDPSETGNFTEIWSSEQGQVSDGTEPVGRPSVNDAGEIVWQSWDGQDWEIFSSLRGQLTDNTTDDVYPQINNRGTVAWMVDAHGAHSAIHALYKGDNFPDLLNDLVKFEPEPSSYLLTRDTSGCPGGMVGKFSFDARLSNIAGFALSELNVRVAALDNNNLLLTALGNTFGTGGMFPVNQSDDYADGWLAPAAQVDVPFTVCLATMQPFGFFVDVLGEEATVSR